MGLLDEAIREHLELKRRRGADPAEVERLEREALGPVRRGPQPDERSTELVESHAGGDEPSLGEWEEEAYGAEVADEPESDPLLEEEEPVVPPAASALSSPAPEPEPGAETVEYDLEADEATDSEDADMLEETPEFLQDTPDHDRLWFEQRPPKDFDFEG